MPSLKYATNAKKLAILLLTLSVVDSGFGALHCWAAKAPKKPPVTTAQPNSNTANTVAGWGSSWQASPLVDTTPKKTETGNDSASQSLIKPQVSEPTFDPQVEQRLKPIAPFVERIEARLSLPSASSKPVTIRLNQLQTLLFGEALYTDAGELIQKLMGLFPAEAEQNKMALEQLFNPAHTQLNPQMAAPQITPPMLSGAQQANNTAPNSPVLPPHNPNQTAITSPMPSNLARLQERARQIQSGSFDESTSWDNDPEWNTPPSQSSRQQSRVRSTTGEGLKTLGRGIASLAMLAAPVAANYFINKNSGSSVTNSLTDSLGLTPGQYNTYPYAPYGYNTYQPFWNGQQWVNPDGTALSTQQQAQLGSGLPYNPNIYGTQRLWGNTRILPVRPVYTPYSAYGNNSVYQQNTVIPGWGY